MTRATIWEVYESRRPSRPAGGIAAPAESDSRPLRGILDLHLWDRRNSSRDVPVASGQASHRISSRRTSRYSWPANRGTTVTVFGCARCDREQAGRGRHAGDARVDFTTGGRSHAADLYLFRPGQYARLS